MVGSSSPVSHLLTIWLGTPRAPATYSWVSLQRVRWSFRVWARDLPEAGETGLGRGGRVGGKVRPHQPDHQQDHQDQHGQEDDEKQKGREFKVS